MIEKIEILEGSTLPLQQRSNIGETDRSYDLYDHLRCVNNMALLHLIQYLIQETKITQTSEMEKEKH